MKGAGDGRSLVRTGDSISYRTKPNSYRIVFRSPFCWNLLESDHKRGGDSAVGFSSLLPSISSSSGYCRSPIPYAPPGMQNDLVSSHGTRGTAICMLASSSSARSHPLPPSISISSSSAVARTLLRSCTLHVGPAGQSELYSPPLPCPPDIVLLFGQEVSTWPIQFLPLP